jgi:hypothetical protein
MKQSMVVWIVAVGLLFSAQAVFCADAGPGNSVLQQIPVSQNRKL